jgi:hypothetical protein
MHKLHFLFLSMSDCLLSDHGMCICMCIDIYIYRAIMHFSQYSLRPTHAGVSTGICLSRYLLLHSNRAHAPPVASLQRFHGNFRVTTEGFPYLSIYLSIYPSIYVSIYPSIHPSNYFWWHSGFLSFPGKKAEDVLTSGRHHHEGMAQESASSI